MNKFRIALTVAFCAFAVTFAMADASDAKAAYRRVHSAACHYYFDDAGSDLYNGAWINAYTSGRGIYCAAPSDSELPHASTVTLNVHGFEAANQNAYSYACVKYYNASGTSCGTTTNWGASYAGALNVSVSAWTANGAGMPYVYTWLPPSSQLYGFYMAN
jgi:hypothetical protein